MSEYPIILIPSAIKNAQTAEPPVKTIEQFTGPEPRKPGEPPKKFYGKGTAIWSFIAVITGGFISGGFSLPILPCVVFFLLLVVSRVIYLFQSYPERLKEHKNDVKKYDKDMKDYIGKRNSYPEYVTTVRTPEKIAEYQYETLLQVLKGSISHDGKNNKPPTEGNQERFFRDYLNQYFPNNIHKNLKLIIPNYEYPYTADFTYIDENIKLYIDIELDEPYVYTTGEPTHYLDNPRDARRNRFFINKGWVVIRFSEEQVVCNVKSCCKTVAQVIAEITRDNSILNDFNDIPDLTPMRQWTQEEAIEMEKNNYRNNYPCRTSNFKLNNIFGFNQQVVNIYQPYENTQNDQDSPKTQNTVPVANSLTTCPYCKVTIKATRLESHTMNKCPRRPSL